MSLSKPLTPETREKINSDPFYRLCARRDEGDCQGRTTMEHAVYYAGKRLDEWWALVPICAYHTCVDQFQDSGKMDKNKHLWIALNRASDKELNKYPRANFIEKRNLLNKKYGQYNF